MSTVDKLFKDKLANHSIPPAPQSWDKVEARISKKNNLAIVLRVAAGIAVLGLLLTLLLSQGEQTTPSILANEEIKPTPAESNDGPKTPIKSEDQVAKVQPQKTRTVPQHEEVVKKIIEGEATNGPELVVNVIPDEKLMVEAAEVEPVKKKRMVLVYTLPSVSKKAETPITATEEDKKTGLQKVMDVAMDVRSSDSPLGELREKKDELFALEFRKDKNKGKN